MAKKIKDISEEDLINFIVSALDQFQIKATTKGLVDLITTIHKCYDDEMMFDSWFRGIDVMN